MNKNDALKFQKEQMDALNKDFTEMGYDPERTSPQEIGITDLITFDFTAGLNDEAALANLYFLPVNEDEVSTVYYVAELALTDEVNTDEKKLEMLQALNLLNSYIAYGDFRFDVNIDILTYRYLVPVRETMSADDTHKLILEQTLIGFGLVSLFVAPLNALLQNRITWEEYIYTVVQLASK